MLAYYVKLKPPVYCPAVLCCVHTTRARARARGSFVCVRAHESRYNPHKPREPRARVAPAVVGTSKRGSQACEGRR